MLNTPEPGTIHFKIKNPSAASQNEIDKIHDAQLSRNLLSAYRHNYYISEVDSVKLQAIFHPIIVLQATGTRHLTHSTHVIPRILDDYSKEHMARLVDKYTKAGLTTMAIGDYEELKTHHHCNLYGTNRDLMRLVNRNMGTNPDQIDRVCHALGARTHRCVNGAQWCYYRAQVAFLHHSSYDITLDMVAAIFNNHGLITMEICHFNPPEILDERYSVFNDGTYSVFQKKKQTIISYNDGSINYAHDTANLQRWSKFTSIDLGCYSLVRETYRTLGMLHFTRITRVHNTIRAPPLNLRTFFNGEYLKYHWNEEKQYWADLVKVYHVNPDQHYMHTELNLKLKEYVLVPSIKHVILNEFHINLNKVKHYLIPRDFVNKVIGYGGRAHDESLKYIEVLAFCTAFTRDVFMGKDKIYTKASMSAEVMHDVSLSLFIVIANNRAERTTLIKDCFKQLKEEQGAGWCYKTWHKFKTVFHRNKELKFEEDSFLKNFRVKEATIEPWQYRHKARPLKEELALIKKGMPKGFFFSLTDAAIPRVPLRSPHIPTAPLPKPKSFFGESDSGDSSDDDGSDTSNSDEESLNGRTDLTGTRPNAFGEPAGSDEEEEPPSYTHITSGIAPNTIAPSAPLDPSIDTFSGDTSGDPTIPIRTNVNLKTPNTIIKSDYVGNYIKLPFKSNILYVNCANHNLTDGAGQAKAFRTLMKSFGLNDYRHEVWRNRTCKFADDHTAMYEILINGSKLHICIAVALNLNDASKTVLDAHHVLVGIIGRIEQYSHTNNLIAYLPLIGTQLFKNPIACFISAYRSIKPNHISLCFHNVEEQGLYYGSQPCTCLVASYVKYAIPMDLNPYYLGVYDLKQLGYSDPSVLNTPTVTTTTTVNPPQPPPQPSTSENQRQETTVLNNPDHQDQIFENVDDSHVIYDRTRNVSENKIHIRELFNKSLLKFKNRNLNQSLIINEDTEPIINKTKLVSIEEEEPPLPPIYKKFLESEARKLALAQQPTNININSEESDITLILPQSSVLMAETTTTTSSAAVVDKPLAVDDTLILRIKDAEGNMHNLHDMLKMFKRLMYSIKTLETESLKDCAIAHHNNRNPNFKYNATSVDVLHRNFGELAKDIKIIPRKNSHNRYRDYKYTRPKNLRGSFSPNNCLIEAIYLGNDKSQNIEEYYSMIAYHLNMEGLNLAEIDKYLVHGDLQCKAYDMIGPLFANLGIHFTCINLSELNIGGQKYPKGGVYFKNHSGRMPNSFPIYWSGSADGQNGHFFYKTFIKGGAKDKFIPLFERVAARNVPRRTFVELSCAPGACLKLISTMPFFKDTKFIGYFYDKGLPMDKDVPKNINIIPYKTYGQLDKKGDIVFCDAATKQNSEMFIKDLIPIAVSNTVVGGTTVIKTFGNPFPLYELANHYDDYEVVLREGTIERYFILYNKHAKQDGKLSFDKIYDETFQRETFHSMNIPSSRINEFYKYHFREITTGKNKVIPADKIKDCLVKFTAITGYASASKTTSVQSQYPNAIWCAHSTVMQNKHIAGGANSFTEHTVINKLDRKVEQTLVIDECSCFCLEYVALLQLSFPKLKIVIVGDIHQTPKVAFESDYKFMPFTECGVVNNLIDVYAIPQDICAFINAKYNFHMRTKSKVAKGLYYAPKITTKMKTFPWIAFNRSDVDRFRDQDGYNAHTITTFQGSRASDVVFYISSKAVHDLRDRAEWVYTAITRATSKLYIAGEENFIKGYFNIHGTMLNIYNEEAQILLNDDTIIHPMPDLGVVADNLTAKENTPVNVALEILRDITHVTDHEAGVYVGPYLEPKILSGKMRTPIENLLCNDKEKVAHVYSKTDLFVKHQKACVPINNIATLAGRYSKPMPKMKPVDCEKMANKLIQSWSKLLYGNDHSVHKFKKDMFVTPEERTHHLKEYIKSYSEKFPAQAKDIDFNDIMDFTKEELAFMAKDQEKFSAEPGFDASTKVLQGVAAFSKKVNIHLCAYARAWNHKLHYIIKKEKRPIILKTLGSDEEFAATYAEYFRNLPEDMMHKLLKWLCIDVGEWDASFNEVMTRVSRIIQKWMGIPIELVNWFFTFRSHWVMVYRNIFGVTTLEGDDKQFSGNPFTLIENTSLNMAILSFVMVFINAVLYLFVGDDSAVLCEYYSMSKEGRAFLDYSQHVLKVAFDVVGEFAGFIITNDMIFPDVWRRAAKFLGKAYRDQAHFDEAVKSTKAVMATVKTTYQIRACCLATQHHYENKIDYNQAYSLFHFLSNCQNQVFEKLHEVKLMVKNFFK